MNLFGSLFEINKKQGFVALAVISAVIFTSHEAVSQVAMTAGDDDTCGIVFQPTGATQVIFRREDGSVIGHANRETPIEIDVQKGTVQSATSSSGVDIRRLISGFSTETTSQGSFIKMVLPDDTYTDEGTLIPASTTVLVDLNDIANLGTIQPAGATFCGIDSSVADHFVQALGEHGVTGITAELPAPADDGEGTPNIDVSQLDPEANGPHFLSSPTCSCTAGACGQTSGFGLRRNPITGRSENHPGIDIAGGEHTPVVAAADGCIDEIDSNPKTGYGYSIVLDHGDGIETRYGHMRSFIGGLTGVHEGECFRRGQILGYMGHTGEATGPHVHFGVYKDRIPGDHRSRVAVNPTLYLISHTGASYSQQCRDIQGGHDEAADGSDDPFEGYGAWHGRPGSSHHRRSTHHRRRTHHTSAGR